MPDLEYVKVVGRFGLVVGDGPDPDEQPDTVWCDEGAVQITPLNTYTKVVGGDPSPWTAGHGRIDAAIDSEGFLSWSGQPHVWLVDLTSDTVNPHIGEGKATHTIRFVGMKAGGAAVEYPQVSVRLAADTVGLDGACDLTLLMPVPTAGGTPIVVGPRGVGIESLTVEGTSLVYTLDDGTTGNAGILPSGGGGGGAVASVNGSTGAVVLAASDVGAVPVTRTVAGKPLSANVTLVKGDVGLGSVDNTTDLNKPLSTAAVSALASKLDESGTRTESTTGPLWTTDFTGTLTSTEPNIAEHSTNGTMLAWLNEWGAYRGKIPPYLDALFRAIVDEGDNPPAGQPAFHLNDRRSSAPSPNAWARTWTGRLLRHGVTMADTYVTTHADPTDDPNFDDLPDGTVIVYRGA